MDAMGLSRYLPLLVYPQGNRQKAAYFGHRMESYQKENKPFWVPEVQTNSSGTLDVMAKALDYIRRAGIKAKRIAVELSFLPVDAGNALRKAFPDSEVVDAVFVLERLRAVKSPAELDQLRIASEGVIDFMLAVIAKHGPGASKRELTEALRREETSRGLIFDYCLITAGSSLNRAPSDQKWEEGDILSLDFGRKLSRLYRRPLPHGHSGRARCGARRPPGRDRGHPARRHEADQGGRNGQRDLRRGRAAGAASRSTTTTCIFLRMAWAWSATRRRV